MKTFITLLLAALLCGCATAGRNFDSRKISEIKKGETTEADLRRMFGAPVNVAVNSEASRSLSWVYVEVAASPFGASQKTKTLIVNLAPDGSVTNYNFSTGGFNSGVGSDQSFDSGEYKVIKSPKQQ